MSGQPSPYRILSQPTFLFPSTPFRPFILHDLMKSVHTKNSWICERTNFADSFCENWDRNCIYHTASIAFIMMCIIKIMSNYTPTFEDYFTHKQCILCPCLIPVTFRYVKILPASLTRAFINAARLCWILVELRYPIKQNLIHTHWNYYPSAGQNWSVGNIEVLSFLAQNYCF